MTNRCVFGFEKRKTDQFWLQNEVNNTGPGGYKCVSEFDQPDDYGMNTTTTKQSPFFSRKYSCKSINIYAKTDASNY